MKRRVLLIAGALAVVAFACGIAWARPGGGDSYTGGGGHGGNGGGGGGDGSGWFELIYWLIRITIAYPALGLTLIAIIAAFVLWSAYKQHKNKDWDSGPPVKLERPVSFDPLRRADPEFSQLLFEDFAYRLFSAAQRARSSPAQIATVAPYVAPPAQRTLLSRGQGAPVQSVVIGSMRPYRIDVPPGPVDHVGAPNRIRVGLQFEANVSLANTTQYTVEKWVLGRDAIRLSKPPGASKGFPCPNCGAPWQANATGTQQCGSCGQIVDNGRFDWTVEDISLEHVHDRPPTMTREVEERGTELETYVAHDVNAQWKSLRNDDPALTEDNLVARLHMIYAQLNTAWSNNELRPARGVVSDGLYDYLAYWVEAMKSQGLRNELRKMQITETRVAKIVRDKYFDAVTIRLWGRGIDFMVTNSGRRVRGSKSIKRKYSEYWTLIRSRARKGAPNANPSCSNCGAPLAMTQSGECEHCGAHVTGGEFDWVLSKIEQDDSYRG
ncbi:MAG: TIM44-like domain-containing protein [Kofleriaceae bacterium]